MYRHNNTKIEVLDSIMGSGKTLGIINWMNSNPNKRFLYVSPLKSEVEDRIPKDCAMLDFVSPNTEECTTKSAHLLELLKQKKNISFTHSLFMDMSKEHLRAIDEGDYTLIIDEEIDFINAYSGSDYKDTDIVTLEKSGHIRVEEENLGRVVWTWSDEDFVEGGVYTRLKRMCDMEMLHCTKRSREMMVLHLPTSLITVCERTIVMTYRFQGSIMSQFMAMKGIDVDYFTGIELLKTEAQVKKEASELIDIFETPSTRKVKRLSMGGGWYRDTAKKEDFKRIQSALLSACRKGKVDTVMYTLPKHIVVPENKKQQAKIRLPGFHPSKCYVYCGTKATNNYANKNVLVHAFNRFPLVSVSSYLQDYGFPIKEDDFALSECIQWVWRSSIRRGEPIKLCFLVPRMRVIFEKWLDGFEDDLK